MHQKIKKACFYGFWLMKFSFLMIIYLIVSFPLRFNKKYNNLWLIGERPNEARDNGYWLYKWILENKPDTNVRFVLSKKSTDYSKMPHKELIIEPGTAKHYIYYILSSYSISTHMHGVCPGKSFVIPFLPFVRHKKTIFLQHGITKDAVKFRSGLDAIIASADSERKLIIKTNPKYNNKVYTIGFCRYDQLSDSSNNAPQKIILIMPTFRKWLRDIGRLKNANEVFKNTRYYKAWNSFLSNEELRNMLNKNNMKLIFFPHNEMQELAQNFTTNDHNIKIGKPGEYDVQTLLRESSILVTDYSSLLFDFVYMHKPVVYYQFDQEDFFSKHYPSSGTPYPFGDILFDEQTLIKEIHNTIKRDCLMKTGYKAEIDKFFKYHDKKNCERNYELIVKLGQKAK